MGQAGTGVRRPRPRALSTIGVPTQKDIQELTKRVEQLSRAVAAATGKKVPAAKKAVAKPAAKKIVAKPAAKKAVAKPAVKKAAAKPAAKPAAKKAAPKKVNRPRSPLLNLPRSTL
ncbi:phasin family protein [Massilia sp. B-10]|nr:phasin family protein [Massilia sp. B-10]